MSRVRFHHYGVSMMGRLALYSISFALGTTAVAAGPGHGDHAEAEVPAPVGEHLHAEAIYECGDEEVVLIYGEGQSRLLLLGEEIPLDREPSASGVKYTSILKGEPVTYWEQGYSGMLKVGDVEYPECRKTACVPRLPD